MAGGDMSEQQQCGDGTSRRPALHIALSSHANKESQEAAQVLPSPVNTDTGESDVSRMTRSLSDVVGRNSRNSPRGNGGGSCNDDEDESYRIAITSVLERLRARGGSSDSGVGNSYTPPVRRRSSSDVWSERRKRGPADEARDSKSVCSQQQELQQQSEQSDPESDAHYLCPDNAATSLSSSASSSSLFERSLQRQRMKFPPKPTTGTTCSNDTGSGLPPAAPARRWRRAPTPSSSSSSIVGSNRSLIDSGAALGLLPPPSRFTRGVSIFEMKRRPSASMMPEDLDAIHSTTASPIAFFQDAADDVEKGDGGKGVIAPSLQPSISISTTPLTKIPYVHGAYSAVAPIFIRDARWMAILRKLMPESHAGVATLLKKSARAPSKIDPLRLMKWAENNPVVAAYGTLNSDAGQRSHVARRERNRNDDGNGAAVAQTKPAALEWDVFLDPSLVCSVDKAMQIVEDLEMSGKLDDASSFDDLNARIAADVEVDRQMSRLMSRMMLAHGSTAQLVTEAVGMASRYNFSRVVEQGESRRRKSAWTMDGSTLPECGCIGSDPQIAHAMSEESTLSPSKAYEADAKKAGKGSKTIAASGIFAERWLVLYAKALKLGLDNAYKTNKGMFASERFTSSLQTDSTYSLRRGLSENSFSSSSLLESDDEEEEDDDDATDNKSIDSFVVEADENIADRLSMCGLLLCLGMEDPNARKADHSRSTMASSAKRIQQLLGAPLRVVLDLKSRKVPPRVWARLLDNLRTRGIGVDGIGSFDIDELRSIGSLCCTPVSKVIFLHSAGDLQRACHAQEIKRGDTVFFNAGSLIWKRPTLCEATGFGMCTSADTNALNCVETRIACTSDNELKDNFDPWNQNGLVLGGYSFQPYAYPREKLELLDGVVEECRATLEDYQRHLELNIGLYVQEFSIGDGALDAVAKLINHYPSIYNLGLSWGGINGATIKGVHGDGYWNQRYIGREWDRTAEPAEQMTLLAPEDHHLFQKAMHAGDWGQALTVNQIGIDDEGGSRLQGLHVPAMCKTPMSK